MLPLHLPPTQHSKDLVLHNVLNPRPNAVDLNMHGSNKEHTNVRKNAKTDAACGGSIKAYFTLDGASTIALMEHKPICDVAPSRLLQFSTAITSKKTGL